MPKLRLNLTRLQRMQHNRWEADEIVGRSGSIIFTPEDRAARAHEFEMCQALEKGHAADERWYLRKNGSRFWASGQMMPLRDTGGEVRGFLKILRDQTERRLAEERRALLVGELDHRVKNTLAVVQAVAAQTLRQAEAPPALRQTFDGRLMALARSHDLLAHGGWEGAMLTEAVERTLAPHAGSDAGRIVLSGPPVRLAANTVVTLNLALHELATNAAKYGALSVPAGRVEVIWRLERKQRRDGPAVVEIVWRERDGPAVRPPERRGFGSQMLERGLAREAGGEVQLDFAPESVACRIRLPLETSVPNDG
jgi:two-component sensor histidine kinase